MALDNNTIVKYTDKTTLKNWFKRLDKPKQGQFWEWFDSYWHKSESLPISSISGLGNLLDNKAELKHEHNQYATKEALDNEIVERARVDRLKLNKPTENATNGYVLLADGSTVPKSDFENIGLQQVLENNDTATDVSLSLVDGQFMIGSDFGDYLGKSFYVNPYTNENSVETDNIELSTAIFDSQTQSYKYPIFIGIGAMKALNPANVKNAGNSCVAVGQSAMREFTATVTSTYNSSFGSNALRNFQGGHSNTAIGGNSFNNLVTGSGNVAVGQSAAKDWTKGDSNIIIGYNTGVGITEGSWNILFGQVNSSALGTSINNNIVIAQAGLPINKIAFRVFETGQTVIPLQTIALIEADTTGKSVVTKEYLNSKIIVSTATTYPTLAVFKTTYPDLKVGDAVYFPSLSDAVQKKIAFLGNNIYVEEIINKLS